MPYAEAIGPVSSANWRRSWLQALLAKQRARPQTLPLALEWLWKGVVRFHSGTPPSQAGLP